MPPGIGPGQPWDPRGFNAQAAHDYKAVADSLEYPNLANGVTKTDTDLGLIDKLVLYSTGAFAVDVFRIGDSIEPATAPR